MYPALRPLLLLVLCLALLAPCAAQSGSRHGPPVPLVPAASVGPPSLPLPVTPRAHRYAITRYVLYFVGTAYELSLLWAVLHFGTAARLGAWAERRGRLRLWAFNAALSLLLALAQSPTTFYRGWWLERQYGLSTQTFGDWLADEGKSFLVSFAIGTCLLGLWRWTMQKSPRRWSLWLWAVLVPVVALGIFVAPVVLDPIYNKFTPLPNGLLRTRLEQLAAKAGIPNAPILVADQSKRTTTANAYVTGLGGTARIVIWDTTLKQLDNDEVAGIVAHEMGHYKLHHVERGFWETVVGLLLALPLMQWAVTKLIRRYGPRWKVRAVHELTAVPVFLLVLSLFTFLSEPATNYLSRQIEHEADAYGLALSGDGPAMARAFAFFVAHDLDDPYPPPFIKFWLFSHPPTGERVEFVLGRKTPAFGETLSP